MEFNDLKNSAENSKQVKMNTSKEVINSVENPKNAQNNSTEKIEKVKSVVDEKTIKVEKETNKNQVENQEPKVPGNQKKESAADAILRRIAANKNKAKNTKETQETKVEKRVENDINKKKVDEEKKVPEKKIEPKKIEEKDVLAKEKETVVAKEEPVEKQEKQEEQAKEQPKEQEKEQPKEQPTNADTGMLEELQANAEIEEETEEEEQPDYAAFSMSELVKALKELIENKEVINIKSDVEAIRSNFFRKRKKEIAEQRKKFIENEGNPEEFSPIENPLEAEVRELYKNYRDLKTDYIERIEKEKQDNLKAKYEIIEQIKELTTKQETLDKTFQEFRELQKKWREIGLVPQNEVKVLWETYHHYTNKFYDFVKINKELRDLDLRKNLEFKLELCEKAEELLLEESIVKAFRELQKFHAEWREIGPVPNEKKDEIWERFKEATTKINKSYQEYFEKIKEEQQNNLRAKTLLCEKAEELAGAEISQHKEWDEKSNELIELQKSWKNYGFAPKKDNNTIYERFRAACDSFFDKKREFYVRYKEEQNNNLQLKTELCLQAESLRESTDWKSTTEIYINLQKEWKTIGPVPRKHSDAVWTRFRAACNYFFDKKSEHFSQVDNEQVYNLKQKESLIEKVQNFVPTDSKEENLNALKEFQKQWTEIGHVPYKKKDDIQKKFREEINARFEELRSQKSSHKERFVGRDQLSSASRSSQKIKSEREKLAAKLNDTKNEIVLLENNIGFFAKSKNAESLIADVNKKIAKAKEYAENLKEQIRMLDKYENDMKEAKENPEHTTKKDEHSDKKTTEK